MSSIEDRPAGFTTTHISQEFIEVVQDSELSMKIEKERTKVLNALGKKKTIQQQRDELPLPDPSNIDCPICSLTVGGPRVVMTRVESNDLTPDDAIDTDAESWDLSSMHEVFYHCAKCNTRIYRDDPSFEEYAETSPHDALTVVAINDINDGSNVPIVVAQTNKFKKAQKKREYHGRLDRILEKLEDRSL